MKIPKTSPELVQESSSFGFASILGLIFVLTGILLVLVLMDFNLPIDFGNFKTVLQYGAAIGSIIGGLSMLFKKK